MLFFLLPAQLSLGLADSFLVPVVVTVVPPLILLCIVGSGFVEIGIQGRLMNEAQREWWSSLGAWLVMYAAGWLALFGTVLFGPYALLLLGDHHSFFHYVWLSLVWAVTVVGGLSAGKSSKTGDEQPNPTYASKARELLARAAPGIFLVGARMVVSLLPFLRVPSA